MASAFDAWHGRIVLLKERPHCATLIRAYFFVGCLLAGASATAYGQEAASIHGTLSVDVDCSACHQTQAWKPLRAHLDFDHSRQTRFPLTGRHAEVRCAGCHLDLRFDAPKIDGNACASCHVDVHQGAFAGRCVDCHNTTTFQEVEGRDIHNRTRFPLTGAHAQITCESCHRTDEGGAFSVLDTECLACHEPDYDAAHGRTGFSTTCADCHTTLAWAALPPFDHTTLSGGFALLGAHETLACTDCHREPSFQPIFAPADQDDCLACHQQDYEQQHAGSGFPTTCQVCHSVEGWDNATFDHAAVANGFGLIGSHLALDCAACHQPPPGFEPRFTPTDENDCQTCHQPDFESAHAGSGFPTTCLDCHNTGDWHASFDHDNDFFPIFSGKHEDTWNTCLDCHDTGNFSLFSCLNCHEHNQNDMDDRHAEVSGYVYDSSACLSCHPTGED